MPRSSVYYFDFIARDGVNLYRWEVIPAGTGTIARTDRPDWGDNPESTSNYVKIPPGVFMTSDSTSSSKYDGIPVGLPMTSKKRIAIRITNVKGSDDLDDLQYYLKTPTVTNGFLHTHQETEEDRDGNMVDVWRGITVSLPNNWILYTAKEKNALSPIWHGVQTEIEPRTWEVKYDHREFEVDLVSIGEAVLSNVTFSHLYDTITNDTTTYPATSTSNLFDWFWKYSSRRYAWLIGGGQATFYMYNWRDFFYACLKITNRLYRLYARIAQEGAGYSFHWKGRHEDWKGSDDSVANASNPLEYIRNTVPKYDQSGGKSNTNLNNDNRYFIGRVTYTKTTYTLDADDNVETGSETVEVGGTLSKYAEEGWHRFDSLFDWLDNLCKSVDVRARLEVNTTTPVTTTSFNLKFFNSEDAGSTNDITTSDIIDRKPFTENSGVIGSAKGEIWASTGDEINISEVTEEGSGKGTSFVWQQLVEVTPMLGGGDNFKNHYRAYLGSQYYRTSYGGMAFIDSPLTRIYYKRGRTTGFTLEDTFHTVHHDVDFFRNVHSNGNDTFNFYSYLNPDILPITEYQDDEQWINAFSNRVRALNLAIQQNASLALRSAQRYIDRYGRDAKVVRYECTLKAEKVNENRLGDIYRFTPQDGTQYNATAYVGDVGADDVDHLPGVCRLIEVTMDEQAGTADCVLLGVDFT